MSSHSTIVCEAPTTKVSDTRGLWIALNGYEIDGVMTRKLWKNVTLLGKFAYYDGTSDGRADRYRVWMETSIKF